MQFDGFSYPALDQVINHVAKYRNRSRGRRHADRDPHPLRRRLSARAEHHYDSPETYYAHTAGLKVVAPSSRRSTRTRCCATRSPTPTRWCSWSRRPLLVQGGRRPRGDGRADRPGAGRARGLGLSRSWRTARWWRGRCRRRAAAEQGTAARVLDLRSLVPLDVETLGASVRAHRARGGGARGAADAGVRRGGRGADHGGVLRPPGGAGRPRRRLRHPVPAGDHRAAPRPVGRSASRAAIDRVVGY